MPRGLLIRLNVSNLIESVRCFTARLYRSDFDLVLRKLIP
jgi:hypothetical protein